MDKRIQKKQRVENILYSLKKCDYLTRSQLQSLHDLKGDRNANRFLSSISEYLSSFRNGSEKVYYLNKAGREKVNCEVIRKKTPQVDHYLLRNQLWIHLKTPKTWENEVRVKVGESSIVSDAMFEHKNKMVFIEVDVSQPMKENERKINKYRTMQEMTYDPFFLIYVTELDSRKEKLKTMMKGLNGQVYTRKEIV